MTAERYAIHRNKKEPMVRLVLKEQAAFPAETTADQWTLMETRGGTEISEDVRQAVEQKGYSLYKLSITFDELKG